MTLFFSFQYVVNKLLNIVLSRSHKIADVSKALWRRQCAIIEAKWHQFFSSMLSDRVGWNYQWNWSRQRGIQNQNLSSAHLPRSMKSTLHCSFYNVEIQSVGVSSMTHTSSRQFTIASLASFRKDLRSTWASSSGGIRLFSCEAPILSTFLLSFSLFPPPKLVFTISQPAFGHNLAADNYFQESVSIENPGLRPGVCC